MKTLAELRPLPEELRTNWARAHQHWFVNPPSPVYISDIERLQAKAGITDPLIVAVIERALQTKRMNVMAWVRTVLEQLIPYGVTTPEEWLAFEEARKAEEAQTAADRGKAKQPDKRQSTRHPKGSNVFLQRDKKAPDYYEHINNPFGPEKDG